MKGSNYFIKTSTFLHKRFSSKMICFSIELELTTGAVEPEGGKSNALYQNPASTHF